MASIQVCELPEGALLTHYARAGAYTDCYRTELPKQISLAQFIEAFYTGGLFKLERLILNWFVSKPSTDAQVSELASGARVDFAAWRVEDRTPDQLLMCDYRGFTRSWLMVKPSGANGSVATNLYFGSAVVPGTDEATGQRRFSTAFRVLLGFHKLYSRALLRSARSNLERLS